MHIPHLGIACESGGFRCVFGHGVLDALEQHDIRAAVYAAASASVFPAAFAAIGRARSPGIEYWYDAYTVRMSAGNGMSEMVLAGIEKYAGVIESRLFDDGTPRFIIASSEVVDHDASVRTQGPLASRLGREQLLMMARGDDSWAASALRSVMFDTTVGVGTSASNQTRKPLTRKNFRDASYASTRMLHAWRLPATIDGAAFIDASYTDGFPVRAIADDGTRTILAIATSAGDAFTNLYRREPIAGHIGDVLVEHIAPAVDLKELGVDFTTATREGLLNAYEHGREVARGWIASHGGSY
jgi:hypothetical protein